MKLVHKIILANGLGIITIALICAFSYHEFKLLQAKLRFVEIADNLNASFLKMRLSEKNYFLYQDAADLRLIKKELYASKKTLERLQADIIVAVGNKELAKLNQKLNEYEGQIRKLESSPQNNEELEKSVREAGRKLRLFSENITRLERKKVDKIISASFKVLFYFFTAIILGTIANSYLFFSGMFKNLRRIEKTANSISEGNFEKIGGKIPNNELGSVMRAINSMSEELKTRHEQLIQSKKLASIGILTAGVAHELGNPLNNIAMLAQTYLEVYDDLGKEERLEYMQMVLKESERIKNIVQNLLDFSRPKDTEFSVCDINHVIINSVKLVQNMLHVAGIDAKLDFQEDLPPVFIDENKIQSVLVNLITNAIQAMSSGGMLTIRTTYKEGNNYLSIEVEDTGRGIPAEFLSNIFDPFFSTKGTRGTGLGLSISYGIIKKHKGQIRVSSKVGVGTKFTIELPIYTPQGDADEWSQNHGDR